VLPQRDIQWQEMPPSRSILLRAIPAATMAACFVLAGCGQGSSEAPSGSAARAASTHADAQASPPSGADKDSSKPLGIGAKNDEPVPNVVGKPIETACRALSKAGHAGEVSYIRRAEGVEPGRVLVQDIEPGTNKGVSMLVYLTVSGPFSEKELSPNTHCANPQAEIDDAPRRHSGQ
jgi:hypothetical protein